jgi:predicted ribosomally synthesized peptide with nif11-like leader
MSQQQAEAFIARVQEDPEFAERLAALKDNPTAVQAPVAAEGFDATPEEIRGVRVETFGFELPEEQLGR